MTPLIHIHVTISAESPREAQPDRAQEGRRIIDAIHARYAHRREEMEPGPDRFGFCEDFRQYTGEEG